MCRFAKWRKKWKWNNYDSQYSDYDTPTSYYQGYGIKEPGKAASSYWMGRYDDYQSNDRIETLSRVLKSVCRSANIAQNSELGNSERYIETVWSDGTGLNNPSEKTIYLDPNVVGSKSCKPLLSDIEKTDVLVASALAESTMKRTVDTGSF